VRRWFEASPQIRAWGQDGQRTQLGVVRGGHLEVHVQLSLTFLVLFVGVLSGLLMQPSAPRGPVPAAQAPPVRAELSVTVPTPVSTERLTPALPANQPKTVLGRGRAEARRCPQPPPAALSEAASAPAPTAPELATPTIGPAERWAVLVGVQDYAGDTHPTYGSRGDINAIRTALLGSGWRSDHILTLLDCQASGQAITAAMSWLADHSGPTTFSLFHFSGHACIARRGPCGAGHTYLWSQDNTFIPERQVGALLGRVQGQAWFDFAGCETGAFDAGLSSPKRLVTGASQANETAYEVPAWNESVWTGLVWDHAFLQGQAGTAPGKATIGQMVAYGKTQAPHFTAGQGPGPQHPYVAGGDPSQTLYAPHP
jgi:hypothetical protein